jgi:hypothetical protein
VWLPRLSGAGYSTFKINYLRMKNFKILLFHEFLQQVKSFKFILMVALSLIVTIFTVYIQVADFKERVQNYDTERLKADEEAAKAGTFAELNVPVIIPPNPLSIFSKGFDEKAGNKIIISVEDLPELETVAQKKNPFMGIFTNFDIVSIVKIIFSLMAIFLISDSIAGDFFGEIYCCPDYNIHSPVCNVPLFLLLYLNTTIGSVINKLLVNGTHDLFKFTYFSFCFYSYRVVDLDKNLIFCTSNDLRAACLDAGYIHISSFDKLYHKQSN